MAVKVLSISSKGFSGVYTNLWKVLRNRVMKEMREAVDESIGDLALVAQEMAPLRSGKLEEAIEVSPGRKSFDSGLSYVRSIWIRPTVYNRFAHRRVGEYAEYIHENLTPAGNLKLGPLSEVKNSIGIVTALNPYIGYDHSTNIAKKALETGRSVYDIVLEEGILTQEDLDAILDPENMIRPVRLDIHARK